MALKQNATEKVMRTHGELFVSQLNWLQSAAIWAIQRIERIDPVSIRQSIRQSIDDAMHEMNDMVTQSHQACIEMRDRLDHFGASMCAALREGNSAREAELTRQLDERDAAIDEQDRRLQILSEDYAVKAQSLSDTVLNNSKATEQHVKNALASIQHHSDFEKEKEAFEQKLHNGDEANKKLLNQLHETKALLTESYAFQANADETAEQLSQERLMVSALHEKIQQLEQEAIVSRELQEKQQRNTVLIDSLRTKVAAACQRLPRVESMAAKLDSISRLNGLIHSTAKYLSKEKVWIQNELAERNIHETIPMDLDENPEETAHGTKLQHSSIQSQPTPITYNLPSRRQGAATVAAFKAENYEDRKVHVRSPGDFGSPSPPPTVQQEQMRRREAHKPRSIMRLPRAAGHVNQGSQGVVGGDMVREIRAGFIYPERNDSMARPSML